MLSSYRSIAALALVFAALAIAHPTRYDDVELFNLEELLQNPENLPKFRSFHAHVMFHDERNTESCTGYDQAMALKSRFMKRFNIGSVPCLEDQQHDNLCMFPTAHAPHGPFSSPQWSAFIPLAKFPDVSSWLLQHRGAFDIYFHPNSGFELNDHRDWAFWAGNPWTLNLAKLEVSRNIPDIVNSTCSVDAPRRPISQSKGHVVRLESAHVRFVNLSKKQVKFTMSNEQKVPILGHLGSTWYFDVQPNVLKINLKDLARYFEFTPEVGGFYTVVNAEDIMILLVDDNKVLATHGKVRIVNLLPDTKVDVVRGGLKIFQDIDHMVFEKRNHYDEIPENPETRLRYEIYASGTEHLLGSQDVFVVAGNTNTVFILESELSSNAGIITIQDYPYDSHTFF